MSKQQVLMIVGVWVAVLPFLGFPTSWDTFFAVVSGIVVVGLAYSLRQKTRPLAGSDVPYVEHRSEIRNETKPITNRNTTDGK